MKSVATALVLIASLATSASASPPCKPQTAAQRAETACKPAKSKAPARDRDGVSRADAERNDRALTRNVLQSIEGELRRQRLGQ